MKMGAARKRALERLAVNETGGLYNLALRLTGNAVEAEDLVLDACRRMSARLSKDWGESCTRPWLYRVLWETFVARNGQPSVNPSRTAWCAASRSIPRMFPRARGKAMIE